MELIKFAISTNQTISKNKGKKKEKQKSTQQDHHKVQVKCKADIGCISFMTTTNYTYKHHNDSSQHLFSPAYHNIYHDNKKPEKKKKIQANTHTVR